MLQRDGEVERAARAQFKRVLIDEVSSRSDLLANNGQDRKAMGDQLAQHGKCGCWLLESELSGA